MNDWDELDKEFGGKNYAPDGKYKVKVEKVDIKIVGANGSIAQDFFCIVQDIVSVVFRCQLGMFWVGHAYRAVGAHTTAVLTVLPDFNLNLRCFCDQLVIHCLIGVNQGCLVTVLRFASIDSFLLSLFRCA